MTQLQKLQFLLKKRKTIRKRMSEVTNDKIYNSFSNQLNYVNNQIQLIINH